MALAYGLFSGRFSFVLNTWNPRIFRCKLLRSVSLTSLVCYIIMKTNLSYWHVLQFRNILCINQWTSDKKSEISIIVICSEFMSCRYIPTGFIAFQNGRKVMVGLLFRFQIWFKQILFFALSDSLSPSEPRSHWLGPPIGSILETILLTSTMWPIFWINLRRYGKIACIFHNSVTNINLFVSGTS